MTPAPPSDPAPPSPEGPPLAPPAERVTWRCPTCGQPRRFVSAHRPMLAGLWVHCEGCRTALGLYVVDANGNTLLRLACA